MFEPADQVEDTKILLVLSSLEDLIKNTPQFRVYYHHLPMEESFIEFFPSMMITIHFPLHSVKIFVMCLLMSSSM